MPERQENLHFGNMISCLRAEFAKEGYKVSNICEEFPSLPIDLVCTKGKGKTREFCFVIVAALSHISVDFQKKLRFYQYLLSLHYKPSQYKIILVIPNSAVVVTTPYYAETEKEKRQDFYKESGFGLWRIKDKNNIDKETYSPITLREKIARDFKNIITKKDEELINKTHIILPFVDKYIHDSILSIAKYYDIKFYERCVDQKLLELVLELKEVKYKNELFKSINDHLSKKDKSDFDFCTNILNKLWSKYFQSEIYPEEHKRLETLLVELYPKYRDHYIHQLQVLLLGTIIIDILIENNILKRQKGFPSLSWLLASSFHDFAYPIQKFDDYACRLFGECIGTPNNWKFLGLKEEYTEKSFSSNVEHILASLSPCFTCDFKGEAGINNHNVIRQFFYHEITKEKNHGLIGSLGLLRKFINNSKISFTNVLLPASAAIALHDDNICRPIHGLEIDTDVECILLVQKLAPLKRLNFEMHPIAFLLILCDNIQDWGRHFKDEELEIPLNEANIRLKDLFFKSGKLFIQLYFNDTRESRKFMNYKEETLGEIEKLLYSPKIEFNIEYWNREQDQATSYKFKIGSS